MKRRGIIAVCICLIAGPAWAHSTAYVTGSSNNNLYIIDGQYSVIKKELSGFSGPRGVAVARTSGKIYVVNNGNASVSVVDAVSGTVDQSFGTQSGPIGAAVSSTASRLYVANSANQSVTVFDVSSPNVTPTTVATLSSLGSGIADIALSSDDARLYVAMTNGTVRVYDTTPEPPTLNTTVTVGGTPTRMALTPDDTRVYVATGATTLPYFDTATFSTSSLSVTLSTNTASSVAVSPDGARLYVGLTPHNVGVYDASTLSYITSVGFGGSAEPIGMQVTDDSASVIVTVSDANSRTLRVIDAATNTATTVTLETTGTVAPLGIGRFVEDVGPVCSGDCRLNDLICRGSTSYGGAGSGTPWSITNADGCTIADLCPCLQPLARVFWQATTEYTNCVKNAADEFFDVGLLTSTQRNTIKNSIGSTTCAP